MNIQVHRSITFEYEKKRNRALLEVEKRKNDIYERYPELRSVDEQLKQVGLTLTKAVLHSDKTSVEEHIRTLEQKMDELKKEKHELLAKLGILLDELEPVFECNVCKDTGFIENKNGQMCACYRQRLLNLAYRQSNLELISIENFDMFNPALYAPEADYERYGINKSPRENVLKIKERCLEFIKRFDQPKEKNLLFSGDTGLGKTFLSNSIAKELLDKGKTVIYQTAPRLLDLIMNYKMRFDRQDTFDSDEYNSLFEVDLLIIDDLGAEGLNASRFSELFTIINTRLLTQQSKCTKTILSTNLSLEKMNEYYDDRTMSRILGEFYICKFFGDDIRLKKGRTG